LLAFNFKNASTVLVARCPEFGLANELTRHPKPDHTSLGRDKRNRIWGAMHEFLQVAVPRKVRTRMPRPHEVTTARSQGLD